MGVSELWSLLKAEGSVQHWSGREGAHASIVSAVEGKAVAIDLSAWIVQATCQPNLAEAFSDPENQAVMVSFNRGLNYLRYGCVPVGITEGRPPAEKMERLQQRFKMRTGYAGGGTGNHHFSRMGTAVASMLQSLGLPMIQSPGEGEAMCAALNKAGIVDACATFDGDVLLFGAHTVYHTLKLQTNEPHNTEAVKVELAGVQSMLGIQSGGADALVALSLLCGGDYAIKGAEHVGSRSAVKLLQYLLEPHQDDGQVLDDLNDLLSYPPDPALEALSAQGCTGCKQCKHPGNRANKIQKHSKRNPCSCCPVSFVQEYQTCETRSDVPCQCDFHTKEQQRVVDKAVRRIQATPGFTEKASQAAAAYLKQRQLAATAVELVRRRYAVPDGQTLGWMHRPDVQQIAEQLHWLSEEEVRHKLLPLLMQWDLCHPNQAECEWVAEGIGKVHMQKAEKEEDCWRYIMRWRRLSHVNTQLAESDTAWLKGSDSKERAIKMSLVRQHQPELIRKFEQEQRDKLEKKNKPSQRKAASKVSRPSSGLITNFYSQQKKPQSSPLLPTKGLSDLQDQAQPSRGLTAAAQPKQAARHSLSREPHTLAGPRQAVQDRSQFDQNVRGAPGLLAELDRGAQSRPALNQFSVSTLSSSRTPGRQAGSSHDAELEELLAVNVTQDLLLQSPCARQLKQQANAHTESRLQSQSSKSTMIYHLPAELQEDHLPGGSRIPGQFVDSPRVEQHGNSLRAGQFVGSSTAAQGGGSPREGRYGNSPRAGQSAESPAAMTARLGVHRSPKRNAGACKEEVIVISPDSQSQEDLEINLLSPSPVKRRRTPTSSPQQHSVAAMLLASPADEGHCLRPAGPCTEAAPSVLATAELRAENSLSRGGRAASSSLEAEEATCSRSLDLDVAADNSPCRNQAAGRSHRSIQHTSNSRSPQTASRNPANRWRQQSAALSHFTQLESSHNCSGDEGEQGTQAAVNSQVELPRAGHFVRRGRVGGRSGRASSAGPSHTATAVAGTLHSDLDASRNPMEASRGPLSTSLAGSQLDKTVHDITPQQFRSPGSHMAGLDHVTPATASTAFWGDLETPTIGSDSPAAVGQLDLCYADEDHKPELQVDPEQSSMPRSARVGHTSLGQVGPMAVDGSGTEALVADTTPVYHASRLQWHASMGASPIDLVTPSTGVASTVATPTFSESSDLVDLTLT